MEKSSSTSDAVARQGRSAFSCYGIEEGPTSLRDRFLIGPPDPYGPQRHAGTPHRHEFVELFWISSGTGTHVIDESRCAVRPRTLHVVAPGELHHWEQTGTLDGTLVLFREDFLTGPGGPVATQWNGGVIAPDDRTCERLERLLVELQLEIATPAADQEQVVRSLLSALIAVSRRSALRPVRTLHDLPARFDRVVREQRRASLSVAECAKRLNVTAGHLSEVVTGTTGRTPGAIIRASVLLEAQRLLARTSLTCAQIATSLDFEDPSYFSRFFRREAGMTPSAYRRDVAVAA